MTNTRLNFDPFSKEFYDDPADVYRQVREQTPVYYSEEYDFYALITARGCRGGVQGFRDLFVGIRYRSLDGPNGRSDATVDHLHGSA